MTVSISNLNFTWANSSNIFTAIGANVNASSYAAGSKVFKLAVNGNTVFSIDDVGNSELKTNLTSNGISTNTFVSNRITSNSITTSNLTVNTVISNNVVNTNVVTCNTISTINITSNTISTNNIVSGNVTSNSLTSVKISSPGVPAQLVYNRVDTKNTYAVPGYPNTTGNIVSSLDTTITPRSATSNVLISMCLSYEIVQDTVFRLVRSVGGSDVEVGINSIDSNAWSGTWMTGYDADSASTPVTKTFMYLDDPSTTSPVTYKLKIMSAGTTATTFYLNRSVSSAGAQNYEVAISQVFLQEIPT